MKKLSIITICYNEPNLEDTCKSIVNQTWQDFEWIVVDGGSNKETQKIWDKYKYRIDKFISEPDEGIYNAMNKGIKLATGKYLNFMNAGDSFFYNDVLDNIFHNKTYNTGVLYGFEYVYRNSTKENYIQVMPENLQLNFFLRSTLRHQATFISKSLFDKYELYDETYKIAADKDKFLYFLLNNVSFQRLPYIVSKFNLDGISSNPEYIQLINNETNRNLSKYFNEEDIISAFYKNYSVLEQLFSIKNSFDKKHKIITILGIHMKIKRGR